MTDWKDSLWEDFTRDERLQDLEYFAANCLKVRTKSGAIEPLIFNPAQRKLHAILERQKKETGRVRAIILKGRQLGVSTYTAGRFFHQTIQRSGIRTLVVGHERRASSNLFGIVKRFADLMPEGDKPEIGASNNEELVFKRLDSGYLIQTASSEGTGRSATCQLLHSSETAFWENLGEQIAGLGQVVPDIDGSEIIIESTACGYNEFHALWRKAEKGLSEYIPIFLPWFEDPQYRRRLPEGFELTGEEKEIKALYELDDEQLCWRRNKISQLPTVELFAQEYPANSSEAFLSDNIDSFIDVQSVIRARKRDSDPHGPLLVSCDPAGKGNDATAFAWRRGSTVIKVERQRGLSITEIAGRLRRIIEDEKPVKAYIDATGLGVGVVDVLHEQGYDEVVGVNFASRPLEPPGLGEDGKPTGGPANRRAELWLNLRNELDGGMLALPDDDALQADLVSVGYRYNSSGQFLLESKEDLRRRGVPSPDSGDAVALLFAEPDGSAVPAASNFWKPISYGRGAVY